MDIPVYLITGFLDAGKTDFINGILKDGFASEDRTLLLCCEEGETEYDPKVLFNVFTYTVDDPAQLTPEFFKKLEKQYRPKQVIIEFNGMWSFEPLYREGLPANWILYQIMCLVDATTFEPYLRNMGQLMMEKILNADMIIFNRCNEELRKALRGRNLRMVNRRADIYLENTDGTSEDYVTDDMAPFDLSGGHLDVPDNDYGIWYVDMMDNPDRYEGVEVSFKAIMCHSKKFKGVHCPGRFAMVCCDKDKQFLALVCKGEGLGYADVPGLRVRREQGRLWFGGETAAEMPERELIPGETLYIPEAGVKIISTLTNYTQEINSPLKTYCFKCENICGTIVCTARRSGDRMRPRGRGCAKKLKSLFLEAGMTSRERDTAVVLRDEKGIMAVLGLAVDERFTPKIGDKILRIEIETGDNKSICRETLKEC